MYPTDKSIQKSRRSFGDLESREVRVGSVVTSLSPLCRRCVFDSVEVPAAHAVCGWSCMRALQTRNKLKEDIADTQGIMRRNITEILDRGSKLERALGFVCVVCV